jgi:hypothetical protein
MKTYSGGCHCGKVRFEVTADLNKPVFSCNCSICSKKGFLLTFVEAGAFKLLSGEDALTDYQFNRMNVHHTFCRVCGIQPFGRGTGRDGAEMRAINVRCLDGVDLKSLAVKEVDGKKL